MQLEYAPNEKKVNSCLKNSSYEELERLFQQFPKCHKNILLADFNEKLQRVDAVKSSTRNKISHEIFMTGGSE
jgi:hypothetical protein